LETFLKTQKIVGTGFDEREEDLQTKVVDCCDFFFENECEMLEF